MEPVPGLAPRENLGPQLPCPLGLATSSASPSAGSGKAFPWHGLPFSHTTHPRTYTDNGLPPTHLWLPEPKDLQCRGWFHCAGPALNRAAKPRAPGDTCQTGALGSPAGLHLVMRPRHQTRKGSFEIWDRECRDLTWPGASVGELQSDQVKLQDSYGHAPCLPAPSPPPGLSWDCGSQVPFSHTPVQHPWEAGPHPGPEALPVPSGSVVGTGLLSVPPPSKVCLSFLKLNSVSALTCGFLPGHLPEVPQHSDWQEGRKLPPQGPPPPLAAP